MAKVLLGFMGQQDHDDQRRQGLRQGKAPSVSLTLHPAPSSLWRT